MSVNLTDFVKHSQNHLALLKRFVLQLKIIKGLLTNQNNLDGLDELLSQKDEIHSRLNESFAWQAQIEQNVNDDVTASQELVSIKKEIELLSNTIYDEATILSSLFEQISKQKQNLLERTTIKINLPKNPYGKNRSTIIDVEA